MSVIKKMNPKIKKEWVKSLRSGLYKQVTNKLRKQDGYCCLGVLCDLHRKITKKKSHWVLDTVTQETPFFYYQDTSCLCPQNVRDWANISGSAEGKLVEMNDKEKKSFKQIANWIQENL